MAEVLLVYEVRPESPEIDPSTLAEKIRKDLPAKYKMQNQIEVKPLFFGINGFVGQFIMPEEDGDQDELEEYLNGFEGVSSIQLSYTTRL